MSWKYAISKLSEGPISGQFPGLMGRGSYKVDDSAQNTPKHVYIQKLEENKTFSKNILSPVFHSYFALVLAQNIFFAEEFQKICIFSKIGRN